MGERESRKERSGGNRTGQALASKEGVVTQDQVNDLVVRASSLEAQLKELEQAVTDGLNAFHHLAVVRNLMRLEVDKVFAVCETLNDGLTIRPRRSARGKPVGGARSGAVHPKEEYDDEAWQALCATEPPARQLSFYPEGE